MKLTNAIKDAIITRVLHAKFYEPKALISKSLTLLADDIYNCYLYIDRVKDVPDGWLPIQNNLSLSFGGLRSQLSMSNPKPTPYELANNRQSFDIDHPFSIRFRELSERRENINSSEAELRSEIRKVLTGVTTVKQLLSVWPEVEEYFKFENPTLLPAVVSADKLRSLLGGSK